MRHVGEAVKGHTVMSRGAHMKDKASQIHLIGIATWGIVDHRSDLIDSKVRNRTQATTRYRRYIRRKRHSSEEWQISSRISLSFLII